jgi:predicted glycosyltransferase
MSAARGLRPQPANRSGDDRRAVAGIRPQAANRSGGDRPAVAGLGPRAASLPKPALLFYCQHSVGLGHLTRSYALCAALTRRFRVTLLCGGELPAAIVPPRGVELVPLPPLGVGPNGFGSAHPRFTTERAWAVRAEVIHATLRETRPAVVLVELFPFGRAKFARELVPLLQAAREMGAFTACSVRDILVSARQDQRAHDERAAALAGELLDAVLVHSDPRFARLEETFGERLSIPVHYTGFVTPAGDEAAAEDRADDGRPLVVVSAGGGRVGEPLLRAAIEAAPDDVRLRVITGPLFPKDARLPNRPNADIVAAVPDLAAELRAADASISQCGYNTALDIVRTGVPALVVPYATPEEDEQTRRALRLEQLGLVITGALDYARLLAFEPRTHALDLDGAQATTELLAA